VNYSPFAHGFISHRLVYDDLILRNSV